MSQIHQQSEIIDIEEHLVNPDNENSVQILQSYIKIQKKRRFRALDIYRGLTVIGMVIVDNLGTGADKFWFLQHSQWNGLTPSDLVFPTFIFILGMAVPLSVNIKKPPSWKNFLRIFILFVIGFFLNLMENKFDFSNVRILGVLQRLSLCYGVILVIHCLTAYGRGDRRRVGTLFVILLSIFYLAKMVTFTKQEIGCNIENNLTPFCNFSGYIDRMILTPQHILRLTDPEGIFSTLSSLLTTYAGYFFSLIMLRYKKQPQNLLNNWLGLSAACSLLVYPLSLLMPFNKQLYSTSFAVVVISISGVCLSFFYVIIDILPQRYSQMKNIIKYVTAPLLWTGVNPLFVYVLMQTVQALFRNWIFIEGLSLFDWIYENLFHTWMNDQKWGTALNGCFYMVIYTILAGVLYRYRIFIRL